MSCLLVSFRLLLSSSHQEFVANFTDIGHNFERSYTVVYNGAIVRSDVWKRIVTLAYSKLLKLTLRPQRSVYLGLFIVPMPFELTSLFPSSIQRTRRIRYPSPRRSLSQGSIYSNRPSIEYITELRSADGSDSENDRQAPVTVDAPVQPLDVRHPAEVSHQSLEIPMDKEVDGKLTRPNLPGMGEYNMCVPVGQFYLLYWLAAVPSPEPNEPTRTTSIPATRQSSQDATPRGRDSFEVDSPRLSGLLSEIQVVLESKCLGKTSSSSQPKQLPLKRSLREVQFKLAAISRSPIERQTGGSKVLESVEILRERCEIIVKMAKRIFTFLLPLEHSSDMASTYWGNIYWYLDVGFALTSLALAVG